MSEAEANVLDALRAGRPLLAERAPADHTRRAWVRGEPVGGGRYRVRAFEIGCGRSRSVAGGAARAASAAAQDARVVLSMGFAYAAV